MRETFSKTFKFHLLLNRLLWTNCWLKYYRSIQNLLLMFFIFWTNFMFVSAKLKKIFWWYRPHPKRPFFGWGVGGLKRQRIWGMYRAERNLNYCVHLRSISTSHSYVMRKCPRCILATYLSCLLRPKSLTTVELNSAMETARSNRNFFQIRSCQLALFLRARNAGKGKVIQSGQKEKAAMELSLR